MNDAKTFRCFYLTVLNTFGTTYEIKLRFISNIKLDIINHLHIYQCILNNQNTKLRNLHLFYLLVFCHKPMNLEKYIKKDRLLYN